MRGRMLGATLLVAGTTIGAGMLALPMTSMDLGFGRSVWLLVALWLYMGLCASLMVEISRKETGSIVSLAKRSLGKGAGYLAAGSLLLLFWSLLAAYISGGSSILQQGLGGSRALISLLYTAILGGSVVLCTRAVDYTNRFLFLSKCVVFTIMVLGLLPLVERGNLQFCRESSSSAWQKALPIFFTSFGFHGSLPSLMQYLHGDRKKIYWSIWLGSFLPLLVYVIWQAVTLGVLGGSCQTINEVSVFMEQLANKASLPYFSLLADAFAFFAIATSFLGVALGLYDYLAEKSSRKRGLLGFYTFVPPLLFSLFYPQGFLFALGFAAIFLSILAAVLPSWIALFSSHKLPLQGRALAFFLLLGGLGVIFLEIFVHL